MRNVWVFAQLLWCCCRNGWIMSRSHVHRHSSEWQHIGREWTFRYVLGLHGKVLVVEGPQKKPLQGEARGCPVPVTASSSFFQVVPSSSSQFWLVKPVPANSNQFHPVPATSATDPQWAKAESVELVVPLESWWYCCENTFKKGQMTQDREKEGDKKEWETREGISRSEKEEMFQETEKWLSAAHGESMVSRAVLSRRTVASEKDPCWSRRKVWEESSGREKLLCIDHNPHPSSFTCCWSACKRAWINEVDPGRGLRKVFVLVFVFLIFSIQIYFNWQ